MYCYQDRNIQIHSLLFYQHSLKDIYKSYYSFLGVKNTQKHKYLLDKLGLKSKRILN